MDEQVYMEQMSKMDRPIPGMSLTNDPENPAPYEQPPQFTNVHEASNYMWDKVTSDEAYESLMTGLSKGVPVMPIVEVLLFDEFQKGTFNPDLMMMMVEPTAYMLIALAERLDIDVVIDTDDDEDEEVFGVKIKEDQLNQLREAAGPSKVPESMISDKMRADMESLPVPSLLEQSQSTQEPVEQPSLMAQPEGQ
jgi:hypothetical protein